MSPSRAFSAVRAAAVRSGPLAHSRPPPPVIHLVSRPTDTVSRRSFASTRANKASEVGPNLLGNGPGVSPFSGRGPPPSPQPPSASSSSSAASSSNSTDPAEDISGEIDLSPELVSVAIPMDKIEANPRLLEALYDMASLVRKKTGFDLQAGKMPGFPELYKLRQAMADSDFLVASLRVKREMQAAGIDLSPGMVEAFADAAAKAWPPSPNDAWPDDDGEGGGDEGDGEGGDGRGGQTGR